MEKKDFREFYSSLTVELKLKIFEQLLQSEDLQKEFLMHFDKPVKTIDLKEFGAWVLQAKMNAEEAFESVNISEPNEEDWYPDDGHYYKHWEVDEMWAEKEFTGIIEGLMGNFESDLKKGHISEYFAQLLGIRQACFRIELEDELYCLGGSVNENLLQFLYNTIDKTTKPLMEFVYSPDAVEDAIGLCWQFIAVHSDDFDQPDPLDVLFYHIFQLQNIKAKALLALIDEREILARILPLAVSFILRKRSVEAWFEHSLKYINKNEQIARGLMDYALEIQDEVLFHKVASGIFNQYPLQFDFIAAHMNDALNPNMSLFVLRRLLESTSDMAYYERIKKIVGEGSLAKYRTEFDGLYLYLQIEILVYDGLEKEAMQLLQKNLPKMWEMSKMLRPLVSIYPDQCMKIAAEILDKELLKQTGRGLYQEVAKILNELVNYGMPKVAVLYFAKSQLQKHPRRTAMRSEFADAGVV